jgi:hypothetical protein
MKRLPQWYAKHSRARVASIGVPANHRAGTAGSRARRRRCRKRRPTPARPASSRPPSQAKIATPEIPTRQKFRAAALDPEHAPAAHRGSKSVRRQRQDQPSPLLKTLEPCSCGPRLAGIDGDGVGGFEHHSGCHRRAPADKRRPREIRSRGLRQDRRHSPCDGHLSEGTQSEQGNVTRPS